MNKPALILFLATALWGGSVTASDVPPPFPLKDQSTAAALCPDTCSAFDCAWSGEWKGATDANPGACDCGIERTRHIPAGTMRTDDEAKNACTEICDLNQDKWNGVWQAVPGSFAICGCTYVSEYCPTPKSPTHSSKKE